MTWWGWMIFGAALFGAELFAIDAQFFLVFFGLSALLVGLGSLLGIIAPEWVQWLAFAFMSLVSMFTFRKRLYQKIRGNVEGFKEGIAGDHVSIPEALAPGASGSAEFRGSKWTITNVGEQAIDAGSSAKVVKTDGVTLHVSKD